MKTSDTRWGREETREAMKGETKELRRTEGNEAELLPSDANPRLFSFFFLCIL